MSAFRLDERRQGEANTQPIVPFAPWSHVLVSKSPAVHGLSAGTMTPLRNSPTCHTSWISYTTPRCYL